MSARILLVEDEPSLALGLVDVLRVKGYQVDHVESGEAALAAGDSYALVLLDAMLPGISGFDVLRELRRRKSPASVIMLTSRGTEMDRVLGFELGVDDYVTKPFSLLELLGRVAAVLRRTAVAPARENRLQLGDVIVDLESFQIHREGRELALPARAFDLLRALSDCAGRVISRDDLMDRVWGAEECITLRTLNNLMVKIRQAVEVNPEEPRYLKTVHGVGYRLDLDVRKI